METRGDGKRRTTEYGQAVRSDDLERFIVLINMIKNAIKMQLIVLAS